MRRFSSALRRGATAVITSWLTWDEATWAWGRASGRFERDRAHSFGEALLAVEFLHFIPLSRDVVALANDLLGSTGCRLASLDSDFRAQQLARHGLVVLDP